MDRTLSGRNTSPLAAVVGLAGVSVGCYNPAKDPGGRCGDGLADALVSAFG